MNPAGNKPSLAPLEILMVDDDPGDVLLTKESLKNDKLLVNLHVVQDGIEGLDFLRRQGPYTEAPRPDVILLDLNMPRMDGRELLKTIKADDELKSIPVVILTTSSADEDVMKSYELQAACYVTKPIDFEQFRAVVQRLREFWFTVVAYPPNQTRTKKT